MKMDVTISFSSTTAMKQWVHDLSLLVDKWKGTDTINLHITVNKVK